MLQFAVGSQRTPYGSDVDGTVLPVKAEVSFGQPPSAGQSPMSEGSYQEEPSPVPEPTMPEDFVIEEQQYREMEEEKQFRERQEQDQLYRDMGADNQQNLEMQRQQQQYHDTEEQMQRYPGSERRDPRYDEPQEQDYELRADLGDEEFVDRREEVVPMVREKLSREETPEREVAFKVTLADYSTAAAGGGGGSPVDPGDQQEGLADVVPEEGTAV